MTNVSAESFGLHELPHNLLIEFNEVLKDLLDFIKNNPIDGIVEFEHRLFTALYIKNPDIVFAIKKILTDNTSQRNSINSLSLDLLNNTIRALYRRSWYNEDYYVIDG
jgi:hypothetical protein